MLRYVAQHINCSDLSLNVCEFLLHHFTERDRCKTCGGKKVSREKKILEVGTDICVLNLLSVYVYVFDHTCTVDVKGITMAVYIGYNNSSMTTKKVKLLA